MRIEELHLKNFRCFKELDIQFPESNLAVFIGLNGAGKSAILDAIIKTTISYKFDKANFKITDDIRQGSDFYESEVKINQNNELISFKLECAIQGYKANISNSFGVSLLIYYTASRKNNFRLGESASLSFEDFEKWFEEVENIESEMQREKRTFDYSDPSLKFIRKKIERFISEIHGADFKNLRVKREKINDQYRFDLYINDGEKELKISQLSEGQKFLIYIVSDIAYQLVKNLRNPIATLDENGNVISYEIDYEILEEKQNDIENKSASGIVLIDEIELHLHPQWQREVLPALQKTFPNIQFIVTTHSPQVLSGVHRDDIFILKDNQLYKPSSNPIGRDSSDILDEIMEVTKRPQEIQELSDKYFSLLNRKLFEEAQTIRNQLLDKLDSKDPLFIRADAMITRMQLLKK